MNTAASTRAEAEHVDFTFSSYDDWHPLAWRVDGYALAAEMGNDGMTWANEQLQGYRQTQQWQLSRVEILMLLFLISRKMRFTWGPEPFDIIDSLLHRLANLTGQTYVTDPQRREQVMNDISNYPNIYDKSGNQIFPPKDKR